MKHFISICCIFFASLGIAVAQDGDTSAQTYGIIVEGDTIPLVNLREILIFPPYKFKNRADRQRYTKLVRDVRIAYPYARMIADAVVETYEYMETLPNEKAKQKHLEEVKSYMMELYKPKIKKMTRTQGKILMKLIDRECNTSSYNIVKAVVGSFQAGVYNVFAGLFGNSLKVKYDPYGEDSEIEIIVLQLQEGSLDYYYSLGTIL